MGKSLQVALITTIISILIGYPVAYFMEVAEKLCDRIAIINNGRIIALGTMEELRSSAKEKESLENIFLELTEDE